MMGCIHMKCRGCTGIPLVLWLVGMELVAELCFILVDEDYGRVVLICGRFEVLCTNLVLLLRSDEDVHFFGDRSITVKLLDEQDPCGRGKIAKLINTGKIDSSELITMKTLKDTGAIGKQIKDGIRLMGRGAEEIKWPIHLEVSRATARAKAAVEAAGGTVRLVYYNKLGFRALLKPEWFAKKGRLLPKAARPPSKQRDKVDSIGRIPAPAKPLPFTPEELEFAAKREAARVAA